MKIKPSKAEKKFQLMTILSASEYLQNISDDANRPAVHSFTVWLLG